MVIISSIGNEPEGSGDYPWYALQQEQEEEIWHKYYSSSHRILLVGEGDFSFSLCLAKIFGSASNIVATSLDSYETLIRKYRHAKKNVSSLKKLGATVVHEVDVNRMKFHPDIGLKKFDRIIYNFPHAGFKGKEDNLRVISKHRSLVYGFFHNASSMLRPDGEIHVNHKTTAPFTFWDLPQLASRNSLISLTPIDFHIEDFPGYSNKRGDSSRCDETFPLGNCSTFIFVLPYEIHKACNLYPALGGRYSLLRNPGPPQSHSVINDHYESNSMHESFGIHRPPPCVSRGIVWPPPRDSIGIVRPSDSRGFNWSPPQDSLGIRNPFGHQSHSVIDDHYESNSIRESFGIARPPPRDSCRFVWSPPRDSIEIVRPRDSHGFDWCPPRDSLGIRNHVPHQRHSMIDDRYESNSIRESFGIARPSPRDSCGNVWPPPRESLGIIRPNDSCGGNFWPPPQDSFGFVRSPPHSFDTVPFEDNTNIPRHIWRTGFEKTSGTREIVDSYYHAREVVRLGFDRYADEDPRRSVRGYPLLR